MRILLIIISLFHTQILYAQYNKIITSGLIEYEKTINMHAVSKYELGANPSQYRIQEYEKYKQTQPQFVKLKSQLKFNESKSLYSPIMTSEKIVNLFDNPAATQFNIVYSDLSKKASVIHKKVYGDEFLVQDSIRKIKWKITDESREIAGYKCRRANGIMLDSIYIVAFYSDDIWVSGGPESFNGLPGMILGVVLPHENLSWYATKVIDQAIPENDIVRPKGGAPISGKQLKSTLSEAMKNWGALGDYELRIFLL